jgi:hypothetical protein
MKIKKKEEKWKVPDHVVIVEDAEVEAAGLAQVLHSVLGLEHQLHVRLGHVRLLEHIAESLRLVSTNK